MRARHNLIFIASLVLANLMLLIPPLRSLGAVLLVLFLPGWGWANLLRSDDLEARPSWSPADETPALPTGNAFLHHKLIPHFVLTLGFSYAITTLGTLILHYLPGPIVVWQLLVLLNIIAVLPLLFTIYNLRFGAKPPQGTTYDWSLSSLRSSFPWLIHPFVLILIVASFLRFTYLGYSEFQGDEALAMIFAAETIEGHEDALFLRGKGPGEVLLPAAVWRLTGAITEAIARFPFTLAGIAVILTLYLMARDFFSKRAALYSSGFLAASGFMVGFSRIVQYQAIVIWMSALSVWTFWQWRQSHQNRWAFVSGLFLGVGLLAHYDAILVVPAILWIWISHFSIRSFFYSLIQPFVLWLVGLGGSAGLFYLPYLLDPQIGRTGSYIEGRIGEGLLKNNLPDFLHFNSFYSSFYYVLLVGLLLIGFLGWSFYRANWGRTWLAVIAVGIAIGLAIRPNILGDWTAIPMGLVLLGAFLSSALSFPHRVALVWFAIPFWGYNFLVETPLTHIYTILPGLTLLAGWMAGQIRLNRRALIIINTGLILLSSGYLGNTFVRHDVEFLQDYPNGNLNLYWTPYPGPPETGFFGFTHKSGWKSVGTLLANGLLQGDYDSNEEEDVTSWYTRHAPRACDPGAEFYFIAADVIDPVPLPTDLLTESYTPIGQTTLPNNKTLIIHQRTPPTQNLNRLDLPELERLFDRSATPAAFSRQPRWQVAADINFGGEIKLVGYNLDTHRAYPGGRILLTLYWQALTSPEESYKIFVHLDSEHKYAQADSIPVCARYPTDTWRPGQIIADQHALHLSPDTPTGQIPLVIGLYLPDDGRRLDILDAAGNPAGVSFTLTEVEIRDIRVYRK